MKNIFLFILMDILLTVGLAGCGVDRGDREKNLQGLSQIEIYSSDGHLVDTISDEEILSQFNDLRYTNISSVTDAEMDALERKMEDLDVICAIIFYKTPVTACHDGNLEKLMEWTVYEDSNIIKEQIAQKTIRGRYISEEFLTFYVTVSDEDKNFILCHFHRQAAQPDNGNDLVYSGTDFYGINSGCFLTGVVNDRKVLICIRKKFMLEKMMTH